MNLRWLSLFEAVAKQTILDRYRKLHKDKYHSVKPCKLVGKLC